MDDRKSRASYCHCGPNRSSLLQADVYKSCEKQPRAVIVIDFLNAEMRPGAFSDPRGPGQPSRTNESTGQILRVRNFANFMPSVRCALFGVGAFRRSGLLRTFDVSKKHRCERDSFKIQKITSSSVTEYLYGFTVFFAPVPKSSLVHAVYLLSGCGLCCAGPRHFASGPDTCV